MKIGNVDHQFIGKFILNLEVNLKSMKTIRNVLIFNKDNRKCFH